jgi:hypothetical protein
VDGVGTSGGIKQKATSARSRSYDCELQLYIVISSQVHLENKNIFFYYKNAIAYYNAGKFKVGVVQADRLDVLSTKMFCFL